MSDRAELIALLREAHGALERTRARVRKLERSQRQARAPLAIVGLGCRYPGANTPRQMWAMLEQGRSAIGPWPAGRGGFAEGPVGAYLDGLDQFDADFFEFDEGEAESVDPRQRLMLEVAWEAVERAGLTRAQLREARVGVYVGASSGDYPEMRRDQPAQFHATIGAAASALSARVAYFMGLRGPCLSIDAACASSLAALHLASQSLRRGECELALAGGVNVILDPRVAGFLDALGIVSREGRCRPFDAAADGFLRGEGCGVAVLERLDDAQRLGHPILAVIRGSAVNHNGPSSGIVSPRAKAQIELVRDALADASLPASSVAFVETQGIGNLHGDAVEAEALSEAYAGPQREPDAPLWLASSKSSLGHTEAASGIAALIKTVMALQAARVPALALEQPSPRIQWDELGIQPANGGALSSPTPLRAGLHSYALTGVNAHVIVEAAPELTRAPESDARTSSLPLPLLLSAPQASALGAQVEQLADWLESDELHSPTSSPLVDLAYSLATTRTHHRWRCACVVAADNPPALARALRQRMAELEPDALVDSRALLDGPSTLAAWIGAPRAHASAQFEQLYTEHAGVRAHLDEVCALLEPGCRDALLAEPAHAPAQLAEQLDFALAWTLARALTDWGLQPELLVACPGGELAAACLAGRASLEFACHWLRTPEPARAELLARASASSSSTTNPPRLLVWREGQLLDASQLSLAQLLGRAPAPASAQLPSSALAQVGAQLELGALPDATDAPTRLRLRPLRPETSLAHATMELLARAHEHGLELNWEAVFQPYGAQRIELPTYAFARSRHWRELLGTNAPTPAETPVEFTRDQLEQLVRERFGAVLRQDPAQLDLDAPSIGSGLDSVMAVQLRNSFEQRTKLRLPATLMLQLATPRAVLDELWTRLQAPAPTPRLVTGGAAPERELSSAAQRTFAAQAEWLPGAYQNLYAFELRGPLPPAAIAAALRATAGLELGLRTIVSEGRVGLRDQPAPGLTEEVEQPTELARAELEPFLQSAMAHVLELERAPVRWQLLRIRDEPGTQVLLMWLHHIAFDGTSIAKLTRTVQQQLVLHTLGLGDPPAYAPPALELPALEAAYLRSAQAQADRDYWRARCADLPALPSADLSIPLHNAPIATVGHLPTLERRAREHGQTPNGMLLWAFGRALLELLDLPAIGVGVTVDLRSIYRTQDPSPCAINAVPVPIARGDSPAQVLAASIEGLGHARLPSSELNAMLEGETSSPRFPMPVMFNSYVELMRGRTREGLPPGLPISFRKLTTAHLPVVRPYLLSGFVSPAEDELHFHARYHPELFSPAKIDELTERLRAHIDSSPA